MTTKQEAIAGLSAWWERRYLRESRSYNTDIIQRNIDKLIRSCWRDSVYIG